MRTAWSKGVWATAAIWSLALAISFLIWRPDPEPVERYTLTPEEIAEFNEKVESGEIIMSGEGNYYPGIEGDPPDAERWELDSKVPTVFSDEGADLTWVVAEPDLGSITYSTAASIMLSLSPEDNFDTLIEQLFVDVWFFTSDDQTVCIDPMPIFTRDTFPRQSLPCVCADPLFQQCYHVLIERN